MQKDFGNRSYAFITAYLLGADRKTLERHYVEDYMYSEGLEKLKQVKDAEKLRSLSRIKQDIFKNYTKYRKAMTLETVARGSVDFDLNYLKGVDIDVEKIHHSTLDIAETLNSITRMIDEITDDVLARFKMPYREHVKALFYMYEVNKKSLHKFIDQHKTMWSKYPLGILIVRGNKAQHHLKFLLQTDKNLIVSCHAIAQVRYDLDAIEAPRFDWMSIAGKERITKIPVKEGTNIYVDCDNTDFFVFLSLLEAMSSKTTERDKTITIKLYMDEKSSPIWQLTDKVCTGDYNIEFNNVYRLKDTKSVIDLVITTQITKDHMLDPTKPQALVSSDSDFFGIIEGGINLSVYYDSHQTNLDYITYLRRNRQEHFDISGLVTSESRLDNRKSIIAHLCLYQLTQLPMRQWTVQNLKDSFQEGYDTSIGYGMDLLESELDKVIEETLQNLTIETFDAPELKLQSLGVEYALCLV